MKYLGWGLAAFFAGVSACLAYTFVFAGKVEPLDDGRSAVLVSAPEHNFLLGEMRQFLESVEEITQGLGTGDMAQVQRAAKAAGMGITRTMPGGLRGKLPMGFKKLGHDTHKKFDQLAETASKLPNEKDLLGQLSRILQNCTSCHARYRFKVSE